MARARKDRVRGECHRQIPDNLDFDSRRRRQHHQLRHGRCIAARRSRQPQARRRKPWQCLGACRGRTVSRHSELGRLMGAEGDRLRIVGRKA